MDNLSRDFLQELFEYNKNANDIIFGEIVKRNINDERVVSIASHIINAHHIWNRRINGWQPEYTIWQMHNDVDFSTIDLDNHYNTFEIINTIDLQKNITYKNSKGEEYTNKVFEILYHMVNHSTFHRGQITLLISDLTGSLLFTDYIAYKR